MSAMSGEGQFPWFWTVTSRLMSLSQCIVTSIGVTESEASSAFAIIHPTAFTSRAASNEIVSFVQAQVILISGWEVGRLLDMYVSSIDLISYIHTSDGDMVAA